MDKQPSPPDELMPRLSASVRDALRRRMEEASGDKREEMLARLTRLRALTDAIDHELFRTVLRGLSAASSETVALTLGLDDITASAQWLRAAVHEFERPEIALASLLHARALACTSEDPRPQLFMGVLTAILLTRLGQEPEWVLEELGPFLVEERGRVRFESTAGLDLEVQALTLLINAWMRTGQAERAVANTLRWLGVDPARRLERESVRRVLAARVGMANQGLTMVLLWRLAVAVGLVRSADEVVALLEARLGLGPGTYELIERAALASHFDGVHSHEALEVVLELAEGLGFAGRNADKLRLLECWLEVPAREEAEAQGPRFELSLPADLPASLRVRAVHELGVALGFADRDAEKVAWMLAILGQHLDSSLHEVDRAQLQSALADVGPIVATHFIRELSAGLAFLNGRDADRLALLVAWMDLPRDLGGDDPRALAAARERTLAQLPANTAFTLFHELASVAHAVLGNAARRRVLECFPPQDGVEVGNIGVYLRELAEALAHDGEFAAAVQRLEEFLQLSPGGYEDRPVLEARLGSIRAALAPNGYWNLLQELVFSLRNCGRHSDGLALAATALGVLPDELDDGALMAQRADSTLGETYRGNASVLIRCLGAGLGLTGHAAVKADFMLGWLRIGSRAALDRMDDDRLRVSLGFGLRGIGSNNAAAYVSDLSEALRSVGRSDLSLRVLRAFLGRGLDAFGPRTTRNEVHAGSGVAAVTAATFVQEIASALGHLARFREQYAVLCAWIGVDPEAPGAAALLERLTALESGLTRNNAVGYARKLASALTASGDRVRAREVLRTVSEFAEGAVSETACLYFEEWIRCLVSDGLSEYGTIADEALARLRQGYDRQGVQAYDQVRFIDHVSALRRTVVRVGMQQVRSLTADPEEIEHAAVTLLCRDAELAQRGLVERMRLADAVAVASGPPIAASGCLAEGCLPFEAREWQGSGADLSTLEWSDRTERVGTREPPTVPASGRSISRPIDPTELAGLLGPNTLLLRATFELGGRLRWLAFTARESRITLVATDDGAGHDSDLEQVAWSAAIFELVRQAHNRLPEGASQRPPRVAAFWSSLPASLIESTQPEALLADVRRAFENADPALDPDELVTLLRAGVQEGAAWVERIQPIWPELDPVLTPPPVGDVEGRLAAIERATERHLDRLSMVVRLEGLVEHLSGATDLVLALDEALYSVPFALLPVRGVRLCRRVASIRTWLSPLAEQRLRAMDVSCAADANLLSLSGCEPWDDVIGAARQMHAAHAHLVENSGTWRWLAAGEDPPGDLGALRAAVASGPLAVATVFGHGRRDGGVELRDSEWDGHGVDLSEIELLVLISCSQGRLGRGGAVDADGFCANLTTSRARSVVAFRQPVRAVEAVRLAWKVASRYLAERKPGESPHGRRASVVNRVRCECLNSKEVLLDTLAAIEHIGLP